MNKKIYCEKLHKHVMMKKYFKNGKFRVPSSSMLVAFTVWRPYHKSIAHGQKTIIIDYWILLIIFYNMEIKDYRIIIIMIIIIIIYIIILK